MDLLRAAVVDITTLVATCHALKFAAAEGEAATQVDRRRRLRRDLGRGTVAYIETLARTRLGAMDDALLARCRVAAELQMPAALAQQERLGRILSGQAGSLDGLAAARQDLWRLAHLAIHLGGGMAALRGSGATRDLARAEALAARLRRRFRKALVAYARTALRGKAAQGGRMVVKARAAALAVIGARGAAEAERLATAEAGADPTLSLLRRGVTKPLQDLGLDWQAAQRQRQEP